MPPGKERSWSTRCGMRGGWKAGVESESSDADDALSVLRNAEVRGVDLSKVDLVSSFDERVEQINHETPFADREEAFDIFKDHERWFRSRHDLRESTDEGVPCIAALSPAGGREPLARRPASYHIGRREDAVGSNLSFKNVLANVSRVCLHRSAEVVDSMNDAQAG